MLEVVAVLNTNCRGPFHDRVAEIMSEKADERFSCMITDVLFPFTQDVAAHFKIPRILLRSSGAAATIAIYSLGLLGAKGYFQIQGMYDELMGFTESVMDRICVNLS